MGLVLKIISGPLQGRIYKIHDGCVIGRADVDIVIDDAKVSGRHAKIEKGPANEFVLTDLGSTNGIRVRGRRLAQIPLTPGLVVKIGNTDCEIESTDADVPPLAPPAEISDETLPPITAANNLLDPGPPPMSAQAALAPVSPLIKRQKTWREYLTLFLSRAKEKVSNRESQVSPFNPLLVLTIQRGLQSGTEWTLGFGPRNIGAAGLDLPLLDPSIPPHAFSVWPQGESAKFMTEHPEKVRLNDRPLSAEILKDGDVIHISDTLIKVSYKE